MKSHLGRKVFKKNRKLLIVFVLLLFISIGYALLSQNLNINGYSKVHNSTWNIHFDNIDVKSGSVICRVLLPLENPANSKTI